MPKTGNVITVKRLLLFSGPMACGKTSISEMLQARYGFLPLSSGAYLRAELTARNQVLDRHNLQELGDDLDKETDFSWLIESVAIPAITVRPDVDNWLLDAVRKPRQVELFRLRFTDAVKHVHIVASEAVLKQRYASRNPHHVAQYETDVSHPNEQCARSLASLADQILDTEGLTPSDIADQIIQIWET
ncbi:MULTISPECIES: AAA family ATPase [Pseudomonas]|uniref:AAA family ATPase n=1 Tax=Pseudomonas TaxID=286 RepID=UPI000B312A7D|nr:MULTISPECIES: AAA family ATPase [Pseudomonas]